ncbi:MAG: hypothetical protein ACP5OP_01465 [Leptospirillia bacterium]
MKSQRPTLREIVRPPAISDFIARGVVPEAESETRTVVPEDDSSLTVALPSELSEALRLKMEERGLTLEAAVREMVLDFLMKDG